MATVISGVDKAWEILASMSPDEVCRNARVTYDRAAGTYTLASCGMDFRFSPKERTITSGSPGSELLLQRLAYFFRLSALWYLCSAKDIALTGRQVGPTGLKGGQTYFQGSHVLPLDKVAQKYASDAAGFLAKGMSFGGEKLGYGDASVRICPLPRVPVDLILWMEDEEFPPRVDILFDSSCELQIPLDIIWSIAMMCVLMVL